MVTDIGLAAASVFHILFGALYFGSDILAEFGLFKGLHTATTVGELKVYQTIFKRTTPIFAGGAVMTLVSGLVYLGVKYHTVDPSILWGVPAARPVLIALVIFIVLFAMAMKFFAPFSKAFTERDFGSDVTATVPADLKPQLERLAVATHVQTALLTVVIVLMIVAANGGF